MSYPAEVYVYDGNGKWVSVSPHGFSSLPLATATDVGGVKIGAGLSVAADGTISTTHFSGDYNDLINKPIIAAPVQSDWNAVGGDAYILNKPVALSQFNNDLKISAFPNDALYTTVPQAAAAAPIQSIIAGANVAISDDGHGHITIASTGTGGGGGGGIAAVSGSAPIRVLDGTTNPKVSLNVGAGLKLDGNDLAVDIAGITGLATVATSGSYNDLSDKPTIPTVPTLATVATTGDYADLLNKPTIPAAQVQSDWNATTGLGVILNKPTIPAAQVQPDWNATTGLGEILNKPTIPAAQVNSDWNSTTGLSEILNKPTIPTKVSDLTNDSAFVDKAGAAAAAPVQSIVAGTNITVADDGSGNITVNAAGSAAAALPISSSDGTVTLDSPATKVFTVSTEGTERLRVSTSVDSKVPVRLAKGSASAPSLTSAADPASGIHFPAAGWFSVTSTAIQQYKCGTTTFTIRDDGGLALGGSGRAGVNLLLAGEVGGGSSVYGVSAEYTAAAAHANAFAFFASPTLNGNATQAIGYGFSGFKGTGTKTKQIGFFVDANANKGQENSGFVCALNEEAGKTNFNLVCSGTAPNSFSGQIQVGVVGLGASKPALSFLGDVDTGTFSPAADTWAVSTGGTERLRVDAAAITATVPMHEAVGSASAPSYSFTGDDNTGVFHPLADSVAFSTGGTERMRVQSDGKVSIGNPLNQGSASLLIRKAQDSNAVIRMDGAAPTGAGIHYAVLSAPTMSGDDPTTYAHFACSSNGSGTFNTVYGFHVTDLMKGKTDIRGLMAGISDGPGKWNVYASGSAKNYFEGQVQLGRGSEGAPSLACFSEADAGIFFATDAVAISTNGTERMRVDGAGQITAATGYTPAADQDLATKKYVDDALASPTARTGGLTTQVITAADYAALAVKDPATLYIVKG